MAVHRNLVRVALVGVCLALAAAASPPSSPLRPDQAAAILNALDRAPAEGLVDKVLDPGSVSNLLRSADPGQRALGEQRLRAAVVGYARAEHGGRVDTSLFPPDWAMRPAPYDADAELGFALSLDRLPAWLSDLPPPFERYRDLVAARQRYLAIIADGGWPAIPAGAPLKPGAVDPRVEVLRQRLLVEDPAVEAPVGAPAAYDDKLTAAVARAQDRFGLNIDGVAGASTLAALNTPAARRLQQIDANLERWRWVPRDLPPDRLEVNIAGAALDTFQAGVPVLSMRVIVGRPADPTPMFQAKVTGVVFAPPWNVPAKIASKEIWPRERRHPGYMAREGIVAQPDGSLQQKPGPKNALGLVKFDLPNPFSVYLHDTPSRGLFAREARALSHGCMRLQRPYDLARLLMRDERAWPGTRIEDALHGPVTLRAALSHPLPVFAFYWTAFVDGQGRVNFRPDVYGWDDQLLGLVDGPGAVAMNLTPASETTCSAG